MRVRLSWALAFGHAPNGAVFGRAPKGAVFGHVGVTVFGTALAGDASSSSRPAGVGTISHRSPRRSVKAASTTAA